MLSKGSITFPVTPIAKVPSSLMPFVTGAAQRPSFEKAISGEFARELINMGQRYLLREIPETPNGDVTNPRSVLGAIDAVREMTRKWLVTELLPYAEDDTRVIYRHLKAAATWLGLNGMTIDEVVDARILRSLESHPVSTSLNKQLIETWLNVVAGGLLAAIKNPAMMALVDQAEALHSGGFWPFRLTAPSGASIELSYGYMLDLAGFYRPCDPDDPLLYWTPIYNPKGCDAGFRYQTYRDRMFATEILQNDVEKVVILGGGWLPELRHTMVNEVLPVLGGIKDILVCDSDPKIDPDLVLATANPELENHVTYYKLDIGSFLRAWDDPSETGFVGFAREKSEYSGFPDSNVCDLIQMKGVASFLPFGVLVGVISQAMRHLRSGGRMMFDLQLSHFTMVRNALVFGWGGGDAASKIQLMPVEKTLEYVKRVFDCVTERADWCKWKMSWEESAKYIIDDSNDPVGMIVTFTCP